jgi:hypothetical protein
MTMGKTYKTIDTHLAKWIQSQKMFFVSTAPLAADGAINSSPKGLNTFRILNETEVAYLDLVGSGVETIAHLKENGRITIMFCAFEGAPQIVRVQGTGRVIESTDADFASLRELFPPIEGARAIIKVKATRISDSCGFGVPLYEYKGDRETLIQWAEKKGKTALKAYQIEKNAQSIDGLEGLDVEKLSQTIG